MAKTKKVTKGKESNEEEKDKDETKEILLDDEDKVIDPEIISGDIIDDEGEDDDGIPDDEEVDPFKDRWEE